MKRIINTLLVVYILLVVCGCGGGGGDDNQNTGNIVIVRIYSDRVQPSVVTIKKGDRVQWINGDTTPHEVISGSLRVIPPIGQIDGTIEILQNNTFSPSTLDVDFGSAVEFHNTRTTNYSLDIVNQNNDVIQTLTFAQGQVIVFSSFPMAGIYKFEQSNNSSIFGILRVFGKANPDYAFQSTELDYGEAFTRQFDTIDTYPYYVVNPYNTTTSYITGTVIVQ